MQTLAIGKETSSDDIGSTRLVYMFLSIRENGISLAVHLLLAEFWRVELKPGSHKYFYGSLVETSNRHHGGSHSLKANLNDGSITKSERSVIKKGRRHGQSFIQRCEGVYFRSTACDPLVGLGLVWMYVVC